MLKILKNIADNIFAILFLPGNAKKKLVLVLIIIALLLFVSAW